MNDSPLLILLVGSNPLPNYLAACALRPGHVTLVYTKETREAKDQLKSALERTLGNSDADGNSITVEDKLVEDATCATTVSRVLKEIMPKQKDQNILLNYTGGTKVMAAHARLAFSGAGGRDERASYLDEGGPDSQPRLRFDDGNSMSLSDCPKIPLTLATVLALHGITHKPREARTPAPTTDDAREILCKVLACLPLATALYCERERLQKLDKPNKATSEPFQADCYDLTLSLPKFPTKEQLSQFNTPDEKRSWFKQWYAFIGGEWLEEWLGAQIRELDLKPAPELTVGVNAFRGQNKAQLEIDIAVVRRHRSYFISCTTDTTNPVCKSKLFEVAVRSQQLGGDLARAALVCLADDKTVSALRNDIMMSGSNTTRVFGLSDVHTWSDCGGKSPNRESLKTWLEG